jgi:hypothetical protein
LFEATQYGNVIVIVAQRRKRILIVGKQLCMRVITMQQAHQQLIELKTADQARPL